MCDLCEMIGVKLKHCARVPVGCGKPLVPFKDTLSAKEYGISGLCQNCQDEIFCSGKPDCNKPCCKD